jgi:hypothetical protein
MSCNNHNPISAFIAGGGGGGGSVNTGVLQTLGGGALSGTLQTITDQSSNQSPLQLSTNAVTISSSLNGNVSLIFQNTNSGGFGQLWNAGNGLSTYILQWRSFDTSGAGGRIYPEGMFIGAQLVPSARLHVRGDGTNPIARFEASGGLRSLAIESSGDLIRYGTGDAGMYILNQSGSSSISGQAIGWQTALSSFAGHGFRIFNVYDQTYTSGTGGLLDIGALGGTFAAAAGSANFRPLSITYTINNVGTPVSGTATGIFLNATETALNGMTHNLMDLQRGGVSQFRVDRSGNVILPTGTRFVVNADYATSIFSSGIHNMTFQGAGGNGALFEFRGNNGANLYATFRQTSLDLNTITLITLGGTTNAFPAIKRNSAAIDFVLADNSGYANVNMGQATFGGSNGYIGINNSASIDSSLRPIRTNTGSSPLSISTGEVGVGDTTTYASAIFAIGSTTRGFLPPRMTTTDRGNIVSPATGLKLYNTTTNNTDTFDGTNWQSFGKETKITGSLEVNIASGKVINAIEVSSAMGLGFYNAAAIIQPVTGGATATYANVSGTEIKENDTFDGYTIGNVVKALRDLGLLA